MIELKRLKLINWHNFENTTFDERSNSRRDS